MGLDAVVMCTCYRDGKAAPPPFPAEWVELDDEGGVRLKKDHDSDDTWIAKYGWEQSCCEHAGMCVVSTHIATWSGYHLFRDALARIGWRHFPVLKEQLPESNGGLTPPAASAEALLELDVFSSCGEIGRKTVLVATSSGEILYERVPAHGGVFIQCGRRGIDVGLTESDFVAMDSRTGHVLFRATRIRQFDASGTRVPGAGDGTVWQDLDTGRTFASGIAMPGTRMPCEDDTGEHPEGTCRDDDPAEFHVERRASTAAEHDAIVERLRTVFAAAVAVGNPVVWR